MKKFISKQAGGTLLGLIIGLVVGLGTAVVVAIVITKTPVPYLSKGIQAEKASAPAAGQMIDPNKPLFGNKQAVKEAASDFAKEPLPDARAADGKMAVAAPPAAAPVVPAAAPAPAAAAPAAPPAAAAMDEKYIYFLQAGAFREINDAESMRGRLALQGVEALISERQVETGTLYRVRIGPFTQPEVMNRTRSKLADSGMEVAVVRIAK